MADDNTTLEFASSSEVTAEITRVYYIDKFGQEKTLEKTNNPDEWGERINSYPYWKNECTIRITPDKNITGNIDVYGTVPENNAVRYIEFTVTNNEKISRKVTVAQYPLTYITNIQGWYSYRSDFGGTNYENKGPNRYVTAYDYNDQTGEWEYRTSASSGVFRSKFSQMKNDGTSTLRFYTWREYANKPTTGDASEGLDNARMYHVRITATSSEYTLGRPRITNGITDSGADNAVLVSPSFMLASQLGAVSSTAFTSVEMAASHCKEYVEVYEDKETGEKIHLDDWRLPTKAEILIIYKYQNESDVMDEVLSGDSYWSASGRVYKPGIAYTSDKAIRCIRDAYDKKTGK